MKTIPIIHYLNEKGCLAKEYSNYIEDAILLKGYAAMCLTRQVDERMVTLQRQGVITFAMSSRGEEACAVATAAALDSNDWIYPQYREAGTIFWRGWTPQEYIHHMFCNGSDIILGRQMPNHFGSRALNIVTVSSPIGTKIPHAAGCAYAMKVQGEKQVALCFFGEGATSEGDFYVGLNFAAVRKAPAIFFCRNNGYAISTPAERQFVTDGVFPKGEGCGITSYRVDGNDFYAIYETVAKAREKCLKGEGPVLIEAMTYRLGAHSTSDDPTRYRKNDEVEAHEKKCPIARLKLHLEKKGLWSQEKENALQEGIKAQIDEAIQIAKETEGPPLESLVRDVYFEVPERLQEQYQRLQNEEYHA